MVCVFLASDSSETVEVIIVKLGMVAASVLRMHHVLIILTFIQGHTYRIHENNKCLIISETIQGMPIKFALQIVLLKVYMTIASPLTLTFIQGHKCVSDKVNYFLTCNISDKFKLDMTVDLWITYMLILMTLMQAHSGSAKAKNQRSMLSATKH